MGLRSGFRSRPSCESKNLRQLRQRAGLTEEALAARLGITYHAIRAWEKGHRPVHGGWLFKLAEALGCSVAELRPAESIARPTKQRQAWAKSPNAPSSPPPAAQPWDAVE